MTWSSCVDDRRFFPPYEAAAVVARGLAERAPAAVAALTELSGQLTETPMRGLNRRVEVDGEPVARVAADALGELGLLGASRAGRPAAPDSRARAWPPISGTSGRR